MSLHNPRQAESGRPAGPLGRLQLGHLGSSARQSGWLENGVLIGHPGTRDCDGRGLRRTAPFESQRTEGRGRGGSQRHRKPLSAGKTGVHCGNLSDYLAGPTVRVSSRAPDREKGVGLAQLWAYLPRGQVGGARAATGTLEWLRIRLPALEDVERPAEGPAGLPMALGRARESENRTHLSAMQPAPGRCSGDPSSPGIWSWRVQGTQTAGTEPQVGP